MKIGILTFHRAVNYGAVLQAYALTKKLKMLEQEAEIIDYQCEKIKTDYLPNFKIKGSKLSSLVQQILSAPYMLLKKKNFELFLDKYLPLSNKGNDIVSMCQDYDMIIVGSDQVWQDNLIGGDDAFFLKNVNEKNKVSYAASFSLNNTRFNKDKLRMLNDFDSISVREHENAIYLKKELKRDIYEVCDPTLLLSLDEWINLSSQAHINYSNYILVYNVVKPKSMLRFADELAKKENKKVIVVTTSIKKKIDALYLRTVDPINFLGLIKKADYVITNSYHGAVFSLIYGKKFFVETHSSGNYYNSRVANLFNSLNIPLENVTGWESICTTKASREKVKKMMHVLSSQGENFLTSSIKSFGL